jgi:hypothetical protein
LTHSGAAARGTRSFDTCLPQIAISLFRNADTRVLVIAALERGPTVNGHYGGAGGDESVTARESEINESDYIYIYIYVMLNC